MDHYTCITGGSVTMPKAAVELTQSLTKTLKSEKVWVSRPFQHASLCLMNYSNGSLNFEVTMFEPSVFKFEISHKIDGTLIAVMPPSEDLNVHLLWKQHDLYIYTRLEL